MVTKQARSPEERKAFGQRMKEAREKKRLATTQASGIPVEEKEVLVAAPAPPSAPPVEAAPAAAAAPVVVAEVSPPAAKVSPAAKPTRKRTSLTTFWLVGGLTVIALSFLCGYIWLALYPRSPIPAVPTIAGLVGGVILIKKYFNKRGEKGETIILPCSEGDSDKTKTCVLVDKTPNSLTLYPNKVVFEAVQNPQGQPWKCHNDNKLYYIHIYDEKAQQLKVFNLPDQQYMEPGIFATRVLELPAHRRIFARKQKLLEQLTPVIMVVAMIVVAILIAMTTGGTPDG